MRAESFADHYSQARLFYVSQTTVEQGHMCEALVFELSKVEAIHIREAMVGHLRHVDEAFAKRVADGLGMSALPKAPRAAAPVVAMAPSPALQIIGKMKATLAGRSVGILIADGSDAAVVTALRKAAEGAGATVKIVAQKIAGARLSDRSLAAADGQLAGTPSVIFDAVAVILSRDGEQALRHDPKAMDFVRDAFAHLKTIGADAGGHGLLQHARITDDAGVVDAKNVKAFIAAAKTRHWDRKP